MRAIIIDFSSNQMKKLIEEDIVDRVLIRYTLETKIFGANQITLEFESGARACVSVKMVEVDPESFWEVGTLHIDDCSSPHSRYVDEEIVQGPFKFNGFVLVEWQDEVVSLQAGLEFLDRKNNSFRILPSANSYYILWIDCAKEESYLLCEFMERAYFLEKKQA